MDFHFVQVPTVRLDHSHASMAAILALCSCPPACSPGIRHCEEQSDEAIHSRGFQHPLERALNRRARNALATVAHGSRANLASLTWPRPSADECSLDDLSSSALGHSFPVVLPHLMRHLLSPPASCRWKSASAFHVRKKALRLSLLRTLTWPFRNVRFAVRHSPPLLSINNNM